MPSDEVLRHLEVARFTYARLWDLGGRFRDSAILFRDGTYLGDGIDFQTSGIDLQAGGAADVVIKALVHVLDTREGAAYALRVTVHPVLDRMENIPPSYLVSIEPCFPLASEGLLPVRESSPHFAFALGKAWKRWEEGLEALPEEPPSCVCSPEAEHVPEKDLFADEQEESLHYVKDIDVFDVHAQSLAVCLSVVAVATIPAAHAGGVLGMLLPFGAACLLYVVKALGDITKGFALKVQGAPLSTLIRLDGFVLGIVYSLAYYLFRGA